MTTPIFDLPPRLAHKASANLVSADEQHLAAVAQSLRDQIVVESARLDARRRAPGGHGTAALERDQEIHRLSARLRFLSRFGSDLCLGRMVVAGSAQPVYLGRIGLTDAAGEPLLVDWRAPAAAPFFSATPTDPMGLASRRRYRWSQGRVTDYWDEVLDAEALSVDDVVLDDDSALFASLAASRSSQMRDVVSTIQADQDAIVRASSRGALVVDGGPGTGKTVVALHRAAYLLYADPHLSAGHGGVLFVGPHRPYLAYVADVLPSLGEEGVQTCTIRDLVPQGSTAVQEPDPHVAGLKSDARTVRAVDAAVRFYEEPPTEPLMVETPWDDLQVTAADWAEAFDAVEPGTPHNEARAQVWEALLELLTDRYDDVPGDVLRRSLRSDEELQDVLAAAWPMLEATDVVGDLWSVPAYLRRCAPWLTSEQVRALQRHDPQAWTVADLPLLDAARARIGTAPGARTRRRDAAELATEREQRERVLDELLEADDDRVGLVTMLRHEELKAALLDDPDDDLTPGDPLAGPFAHVVVDEAQELTDAEWQMLLRRCPSRSLTIVGDRAQARRGFTETWSDRLARVGVDRVTLARLTVNYRTPREIMTEAEPVIRAALADANVPTSVRSTGVPVTYAPTSTLAEVVGTWLATHDDGVACVIATDDLSSRLAPSPRVRALTPVTAKGLEFDLVVLVEPEALGDGVQGAVDRYVAMTRATQRLVVLTDR